MATVVPECDYSRPRAAADAARPWPGLNETPADGGAVPVGKLERPKSGDGERTAVRKLAKGTRAIAAREARFISVHAAESKAGRVVDCHIAPNEEPAFTGSRMFTAAIEAGLRETSRTTVLGRREGGSMNRPTPGLIANGCSALFSVRKGGCDEERG